MTARHYTTIALDINRQELFPRSATNSNRNRQAPQWIASRVIHSSDICMKASRIK